MFDVKASASAGYRGVEVLTGPDRRRRWSDQDKARVVAESLVPGASPSVVARRWQICPQQFFTCRRQVRDGQLALASDLTVAPASEPALVRILAERPVSALPAIPPVVPSAGAIEIEVAGSVVRVGTSLPARVPPIAYSDAKQPAIPIHSSR